MMYLSYNPEDSDIMEEENVTVDDGLNDYKFIAFKSQLMTLFCRCLT